MTLKLQEVKEKIISIEKHIDDNSRYYGSLLRWKHSEDDDWHYGIGLSNTYIFDTGLNLQVFERHYVDAMLVITIDPFTPDETIERLKHALRCFADWSFDPLNWNDEHFAKLVVANKPISNKVSNRNPDAKQKFKKYLREYEPRLNPVIRGFILEARTWVYILFFLLGLLIVFIPGLIQNPVSVNIPIYMIIVLLVIGSLLLTWLMLQLSKVNWSGFQEKKLWNWLELLIVPLWLAFGAFYLNYGFQERQKQESQERIQQEALKAYLAQMKDLLVGKESQNPPKELSGGAKEVAEALTLTVLNDLNGERKSQVIKFLRKTSLVDIRKFDLSNANLKEANLEFVNLEGANLTKAKLNSANLFAVNITSATLYASDLSGADLNSAILKKADLTKAILIKANLIGTQLEGANLSEANLTGACYSKNTRFPNDFNPQGKGLREIKPPDICD